MKLPLLTTKLYIPPKREKLVSRQRLLTRLNQGFDCKLSLLSAPAGFGKTTLLSDWLYNCGRTVVWISLDNGDNDLNRFLSYLITALRKINPDIGEGVLDVLNSPQPPMTESLLTDLINELSEINNLFVLVLDDFHTIQSPDVHKAVTFLIENQPLQMHLVISGRADPPWPMARLRARCEMIELRTTDLRFDEQESTLFLNEVMGLSLSKSEVKDLETRTEGWIAGLQMAALSMRNRADSSQFISSFAGSHRFVLDYLMEEVLHQQPEDIQAFLLKTSILDRLTEPLCDAITGGDDSRDMMYELDQANLFLMPLDDDRQWYRYHHLFADLLRSRLQQTWPEQVPELHLMASEWFEGEGLIEQAIQHAFQAEQMSRAADLVESYAIQVISQSKAQTLLDWIESLPTDLVALRPLLCAYLGWSRYWTGQRESVEECLQLAEQGLQSSPEKITESKRTLIEGYIAAIRAYLAITNEDIFRVIEMSQKALELLPEGNYMRGIAAVALGVTYWGLGDALRSQAAFQQAVDIARKGGYRNLAISAMCYVGIQMEKRGQLHEALSTYNEAMKRSTKSGSRWMPLSCFPVERLGNLWREWNDLDKAAHYVNEGVAGCEQLGHPDILADGYITKTRLLLARNDLKEAKKTLVMLDHLAETANTDPWADTWIDECRLAIWIREGNLDAAVRWVDSSHLIIDNELSYLHDLNHINLARVLIAQGSQQSEVVYLEQAHELLSRLLEAAKDAGWVQDMIKISILQSLAFLYQTDVDRADKCIREALSLAEPGGYVRIFVDEGEPMEKLLHKAADEGFMREYTEKLLQNLAGKEEDAALPRTQPGVVDRISPLIEPLTERELQVLRLLLSELSVPEIADELIVGVSTIRTHVKNIYAKLGVHSRYQAVSRARQLGLV